jgi:hypothetical protein
LWTLPHLEDRKINMKYNRRGENDGKDRARTAGIYSKGFKAEAVALAEKREKPIGQIAAD